MCADSARHQGVLSDNTDLPMLLPLPLLSVMAPGGHRATRALSDKLFAQLKHRLLTRLAAAATVCHAPPGAGPRGR